HERLALLEVDRGQQGAAAEHIALLRRLIGASNDPQYNFPLVELSAELALWQHRPKDAWDEAVQALGRLGADAFDQESIRLVGPFVAGNISRVGPVIALALRAEAELAELARGRSADASGEARGTATGYLDLVRAIDGENSRGQSPL